MADHKAPDYELEAALPLDQPHQLRALFDDTRQQIVDLLMERAATISELAETMDRPKGTIGHHVGVLEEAGLIRVVRTKKVRAIEAKYYGRTARTFVIGDKASPGVDLSPDVFLARAAAEYGRVMDEEAGLPGSTLRYARITPERAKEWADRLYELAEEFTALPRAGETIYGLLIAMYPTDRPHLPDKDSE